jgi:hypothetical protein
MLYDAVISNVQLEILTLCVSTFTCDGLICGVLCMNCLHAYRQCHAHYVQQ